MRILLIGGAGFIGSAICQELIKKNNISGIYVYDAGLDFVNKFKRKNVFDLRFKDIKNQINFIAGDVRTREHMRRVIRAIDPTHVIYLAAIPVANIHKERPEEMRDINFHGIINFFEALQGNVGSLKHVIYTSSSFRYGHFQYDPADENHPCLPIDCYGWTKHLGEDATKYYCQELGLDYSIIIPSACYGGPQDTNKRVSGIFFERAVKGKPVYLEDGGKAKLDFTHIDDLVQGYILALIKNKARNQVFNITYGQSRSIKELYDIVNSIIPLKVEYRKSEHDRPKRGTLDISKAKKLLGYKPKYPLEKAVPICLEGYKKFYKEKK